MTKIKIPAARVKQGDLILYMTALQVKDLISDQFYSVERFLNAAAINVMSAGNVKSTA